MPSEDETLPYTYFSLFLLSEQTTCFYLPNNSMYVYHIYCLPKEITISCTHKQLRSVLLSSIFSCFQLILLNCTLTISHLTLSNMKRIIELLACSDLVQDSFLHILIIKSSQMNNHTNSVQNPNNSDCHVSPSLGNYTIA